MIFLVLAVTVQVLMGLLLKVGELYQQDRLVVMGCNYLFGALIAAGVWAAQGTGLPSAATLALGPVGGFFYAAGLLLWMGAIAAAGLGTSTAALRLSVLWPTLLSLLAFGERPALPQLAGIALTFGVLGLLGASSVRRSRAVPGQGGFAWLVSTFVLNGGTGITQKLFTEWSPATEKMALLTLIFGSAAVLSGAAVLARRRRLRRGDVLRGAAFGIGNLAANAFLLMGLERVSGAVAFPFTSVGVILLAAIAGAVLWRERPGPLGTAAIALAALALVLMLR
jgi:drug/metabolite transporter (DMT)-like permease